jgi:thiol-disulfide isomerase/thioredoxin
MRFAPLPLLLAIVCLAGCGKPKPALHAGPPADSAVVLPIDAAGLRARVADGRARVTLVNLWATWCGPCREEFPALVAAATRHRADGLRLLLVSGDFDDELTPVRRFLEANGIADTSFVKHEADMTFINGVHPAWSGALPATLLYDSHGRLLEFWEGAADSTRFEQAITRALHSKGAPS